MNPEENQAPRDYGGWRLRRGIGLLGLGLGGTAAVLGALLVLVITAAASPAALLYVAPPLLVCGGAGLTRIGGEPLALAALRRARWRHAALAGLDPLPGRRPPPRTPAPGGCPGCWRRWRCWTPTTATAAGTPWCWTAAPGR